MPASSGECGLKGLPLSLDLDQFVVPDPSSAFATAQIAGDPDNVRGRVLVDKA
jgi:hypothetical protein